MSAKQKLSSGASMFNLIRVKAGKEYKDQVPELSASSPIGDVATPILTNPLIFKEFTTLLGAFIKDYCDAQIWENPLAELISTNTQPLGEFSREIGSNPVEPRKYNPNHPEKVLEYALSEDKVVYYVRNVKEMFKISIPYEELQGAFSSFGDFNTYVSQKMASQVSGMQLSMYNHVFTAINANYDAGVLKKKNVKPFDLLTENDIKNFVFDVKSLADKFEFASSDFNNYGKLEGANGEFIGWSKRDDVMILATVDFLQKVNVNYLASVFNLSPAEINHKIIKVKSFDYDTYDDDNVKTHHTSKIQAMVCDKRLFRYSTDLDQATSRYNEETLVTTYWRHWWATYAINPMANCIVFSTDAVKDIAVTPIAKSINKTNNVAEFTVTPEDTNFTIEVGQIQVGGSSKTVQITNKQEIEQLIGKIFEVTTKKNVVNVKRKAGDVTSDLTSKYADAGITGTSQLWCLVHVNIGYNSKCVTVITNANPA